MKTLTVAVGLLASSALSASTAAAAVFSASPRMNAGTGVAVPALMAAPAALTPLSTLVSVPASPLAAAQSPNLAKPIAAVVSAAPMSQFALPAASREPADDAKNLTKVFDNAISAEKAAAPVKVEIPTAKNGSRQILKSLMEGADVGNGSSEIQTYKTSAFYLPTAVALLEKELPNDKHYKFKTTVGFDKVIALLASEDVYGMSQRDSSATETEYLTAEIAKLNKAGLIKAVIARTQVSADEDSYMILHYFRIYTVDGNVLELNYSVGD